MRRTQVLDGAYQEHPLVQRQGVAYQRPAAARQRREAFPECGVEPLTVGRIEHSVPLRPASERLHAYRCAIDPAAFGLDDMSPLVALDDWRAQAIVPRTQSRSSARARMHGSAQGLPQGPAVSPQAIGTDHQGPTCRTASHALRQPPAQGQVALGADLTAQPPPGSVPIMASAIHTRLPCCLTRLASACPCPKSRGCATRYSCTACP